MYIHHITGDQNGQIHFEGYQVSNVCMALVRDECLIPTKDAPELGYVKESTNEQYVPDVFYKVTNIFSILQYQQSIDFCFRIFKTCFYLYEILFIYPFFVHVYNFLEIN